MRRVKEPLPLAAIVGQNARAHRKHYGATLEDVAKSASRLGLRWNTGRVGDLESGRIPATLPTLFVLAQALGEVTKKHVSIADLVWYDGWVELNPSLTIRGETLRESLEGEPVELVARDIHGQVEQIFGIFEDIRRMHQDTWGNVPEELQHKDPQEVARIAATAGVAERRLCKDFSIDPQALAALSLHLWGRSFSEERDRRAGEGANAQRRGRVSRELKSEIETYLESGTERGDGQ